MTITAEEASTQFLTLLDRATAGESVTITRQGMTVAKIISAAEPEMLTPAGAVERLKELRKGIRLNGLSIREMIDEGRKY